MDLRKLILNFSLVFGVLFTSGQTFNVDQYTVEEGLVINTVLGVYQDSKGYLWVCTNGGGISVYDGVKFESITDKDGLPSNVVYSVEEDDFGNYFIATKDGLCVYSRGKFKTFTTENGLPQNLVFSVLNSKNHGILLASIGGICQFMGDTIIPLPGDSNLAKQGTYSMFEDSDGDIWFGTMRSGAFEYNGSTSRNFGKNKNIAHPFVFTIAEDEKGSIWLGTAAGFNKIDAKTDSLSLVKPHVKTSSITVRASAKGQDGALWFGTQSGLYKLKNGVFSSYIDENGLPISDILSVVVDNEGSVWMGTNGKGLAKLNSNLELFANYSTKEGLSNDIVHSIFEDSKGVFWIGSDEGIVEFTNGEIVVHNKTEVTEGKFIGHAANAYDIKEDSEGNLWIATFNSSGAIVRYDGSDFKSFDTGDDYLNQAFCLHIEDDHILVGGRKGLMKFKGGQFEKLLPDEIKREVWSVTKTKDGHYWLGTDKGAILMDATTVEYFNENHGFVKGRVRKIVEDEDGMLWFATEQGLYRYDHNTFDTITTNDGLSADNIFSLLLDKNGLLWIGTAKGIQKFNTALYNKSKKIKIVKYAKLEGFIGVECNMNAAFEDSKGRLWFGTVKGVTRLDPSLESKNLIEPQTHITNLRLQFENFDFSNFSDSLDFQTGLPVNLELPYSKNHLSFDFVANSFKVPEKVRYRYMLEGLDEDWLPATKNNEAVYPHIPEGSYTFKVIAMNNDGVWNKEPISFSFTINAPWYRTWWAILIYVVAISSGFFTYTRWRTAALKKQKQILEEQVAERTAEVVKEKEKVEEINKQVLEQNEVIEEKNKEITDSINYAKGIQDAILPNMDRVKQNLPESFILFRPKDIVSGDFYWMDEKDGIVFFTAADCTGHGVPGAFVSMVGVNGLKRSVNGFALRKPSDILDKLRGLVEETFKKRKDGMDIGLCALNKERTELQYAGANNPLWVIRKKGGSLLMVNGEEIESKIGDDFCDLYEVKADKQPVGQFEAATPFTNNVIGLEKGDSIYVFSDGYPDQFGGPKGKKFMSKSMKKMLISIYDKDMEAQKEFMNARIEHWMEEGDIEQIDDICVFGVRV